MLILIEGPESCGKSTQTKLLADLLTQEGYKVFATKEPGSPHDELCKGIRGLLLDPKNTIDKRAALLLFMADRAQHIQHVKKALDDGQIVISDRSSVSSYVYYVAEHYGYSGFGDEEVVRVCKMLDWAQQIIPDVCFICSASLENANEQLSQRATLDRIEQKPPGFHINVHNLFQKQNIENMRRIMECAPKAFFWPPATYENGREVITNYIRDKLKEIGLK